MLFHLPVSMGSFKLEVLRAWLCFNDTGRSYVFESQFPICMSSIKSAIKQRLCEQFIQK
jgi:hypothetical protein